MRRYLCLVVFFACAPFHTYPPPNLAPVRREIDFDLHAKRVVLPNGMVVVLLPDEGTSLVNVGLRYLVGANGDPDGKGGLAHLTEHAMFELRPNPQGPSMAERLSHMTYNAFTNWTVTHYTTTTTSDRLAEVLQLESERMHPSCGWLSDDVVAREREVVLNEIRMRQGAAAAPFEILLKEVFPGDTHFGRFIGGSLEEVGKLTRADICAFMLREYSPKRAVLFVSGAVDPQTALPLIQKLFATPGSPPLTVAAMHAPQLDGTVTHHTLPVLDAGVEVVFAAPEFGSPDRPAAELLRYSLANAVQRLYQNDFVMSANVQWLEPQSLWIISVWVNDPKREQDAADAVFKEIKKMTSDLHVVTTRAVARQDSATLSFRLFRSIALSSVLSAMESPTERGEAIAEYATAKTPGLLPKEVRAVATMEAETVALLAERELRRDKSHVIFIDPDAKAAAQLRRAEVGYDPKEHDIPEWSAPVAADAASRPEPFPQQAAASPVTESRLANGLRVWVAPSFGFPVVNARLVFPAGLGDDAAESPCLAWLAGETLRGRLRSHRGVEDIKNETRVILTMAGNQSVSVDQNSTTFGIHGPGPNQDALLWQLGWRVIGGEYETNGNQVIFRDALKHTAAERLDARYWKVLQETFTSATACSDLQQADREVGAGAREDFRHDHFEPSRATLLLTGAWDEETPRRVGESFGDWASVKAAPSAKTAHVRAGDRVVLRNEMLSEAHLVLGFELRDDPEERAAAKVLAQLLRMRMHRLRTQLASTYTTSAELTRQFGSRILLIGGDFNPARAQEMFGGLIVEMNHIRSGEDFAADFVRARRATLHQALSAMGDTTRLAHALSAIASEGLPIAALDEEARRIATLTPAALRTIIDRDLRVDRAALVVQAPKTMDVQALSVFGGTPRVIE